MMNSTKILFMWLVLVLFFSMAIFLAGLGETARFESFLIVEGNILNESAMPTAIWDDYEEFKSTYIFSNEPFILLLNFIGLSSILYLFYASWQLGRDSPELELADVFLGYNILLIFLLYVGYSIFTYLVSIFVNQLIVILFSDIYNSIFVYKLLIEYFPGLVLATYLTIWLSNQIKYFDVFQRP